MIELTQEHTKVIRAVILKTAGGSLPSDIVNDLVQDSAVKLLEDGGSRSLKEYDADRGMALSTFIGMVAKSVTLDYLRSNNRMVKRSRRLDADADEGVEQLEAEVALHDHAEDALSMLIRREQRERLTSALGQLSKDDRELLEALLTGDENAAKKKLAKEHGVKEVAIRVRKHRIAERLRRILQSQG